MPPVLNSRAIVVLGMHRSGTSAITRGIAALGVYLGNDFLDAQPDNPTGFWEDRNIYEINERIFKILRLRWDDAAPIDAKLLHGLRFWVMRRRAGRYIKDRFSSHPLWGFKDPRTLRLLPFWQTVLRRCRVDDAYIVVIRHPRSVAASLFARQGMAVEDALRLWLAHMVPFLRLLAGRPWVVVDYDLLMQRPAAELARIAGVLAIGSSDAAVSREIDRFADEFLDESLRHTTFAPQDLGDATPASRVTRNAYAMLYDLATDRLAPNGDAFWNAWEKAERDYHVSVSPSTALGTGFVEG